MTKTFRDIAVAIGACAVLAGCGGAGDESSGPAPSSEHAHPSPSSEASLELNPQFGTALAFVQISDTHRVDFFEIGRGNLMVHEDRHADLDGEARTESFDVRTDSPVALYRDLMGHGADRGAIERLQSFEARLAETRAARAASGETAAAAQPEVSAAGLGDMVSKNHSVGATPPGWNWDSDASWFVRTFCTLEGRFHCQANMNSFRWLVQASSGRVHFFNQDFSRSATLTVAYNPCDFTPFWEFCTEPFRTLFTLRPMPRHVVSNTFSGDTSWSTNATGSRFGMALNFF
jgi:hypothetical protein